MLEDAHRHAALDRETPFKCTAGLHNAVRHRAADTGFEHHGFLNVLLATRQAFDGAGRVFKNKPAPTNLEVPPHRFLSDTRLLIGEHPSA